MNSRERFLEIMRFEKPDRVPLYEWLGFWPETIHRWYSEGLPWEAQASASDLGFGNDYFGFDSRERIEIDVAPIPYFVTKTLYEDSRFRVHRNHLGITLKSLKFSTSMPSHLDFPVKNRADLEEMKKRLDPHDPRRYPKDWSQELIEHYNMAGCPVYIHTRGFFDQLRSRFMGLERLIISFYREPELVHDMLDFWTCFLIEVMEEAVENVKIDFVSFGEDIAYKNGPFISPRVFSSFILPCYQKVTQFLRSNGIEIIMVDSDGNPQKLIPLFLKGGVNCLWPLEVQAGMDAMEIRRQFGRRLLLIGNIDKRALAQGKKEIEREVESKIPLILEGGYIPSVDHAVPSDIPFRNYVYYLNLLKEISVN